MENRAEFLALPGFSPRPVYKPGDTDRQDAERDMGEVSIHARFISRAIRLTGTLIAGRHDVSIHARFISRAIQATRGES